ncbi:hypothetical protein BO71DRAFT_406937 [Aspergillus ellipticus CBS 707.79]|uniref:Uncharacterized protein n=1 Tax=Aspergillus ellipticus CBS 707.79 TaxID=1448320 RepID=A0A319EZG8_9EURO|nr:hypothetical protein BO71DRAFT_406937 [Aspergillus ellipticus CBS 707.79]
MRHPSIGYQEQGLSQTTQRVPSRPDSQATSGRVSNPALSRLPTPVNPPKSDLYSHRVYLQEGRRGVLSLGKRNPDLKRYISEQTHTGHRRSTQGGQRHQSSSIVDNYRQDDRKSDLSLQKTDQDNDVERPSLRRTNRFPASISVPYIHDQGQDGHGHFFPLMAEGQPPTRVVGMLASLSHGSTAPPDGNVPSPPRETQPTSRKVRLEDHHIDPNQSSRLRDRLRDNLPRPQAAMAWNASKSIERSEFDPPKRIRWTSKFENLRAQDKDKDKEEKDAPVQVHAQFPQDQDGRQGIIPPQPIPYQDSYIAVDRRMRNRNQTDRMVSSPQSHHGSRIPSVSIPVSISGRSTLTARANTLSQVWEAKPREYWLGRFMTLTNAFHYEDSFQEPDVATGFGMLSSYSRPLGDSDGDHVNYRIKRAFMVLENVCVADEASKSLRDFRNEYVCFYGDQWME